MGNIIFDKKLFMVESVIKNGVYRKNNNTILYNYEQFREVYICPCGCANIIKKISKGQDKEGNQIVTIEDPVKYPLDLFDSKKKCSCEFRGKIKDLDAKSFVALDKEETVGI